MNSNTCRLPSINRSITAAVVASVLSVGLQSSFAQLGNAQVGRSSLGAITQIGRIGQSSVSVNSSFANQGRFLGQQFTPASGAYASTRAQLAALESDNSTVYLQTGMSDARVRASGTTSLAYRQQGRMISYFGLSPSAMAFAASRVYSGRGGSAPPIAPVYQSRRQSESIYQTRSLAVDRAYQNRIYGELEGRAIQDSLTAQSKQNSSALDEQQIEQANTGTTPVSRSQIMSRRIEVRSSKEMARGWSLLKSGELTRARTCFKTARLMLEDDAEARVGGLLAALANGQVSTAEVDLKNMLSNTQSPFAVSVSLDDLFADANTADRLLASCAAMTRQEPDSDAHLALHAYMLWLDGQIEASQDAATALQDRFRNSPFASFSQMMDDQLSGGGEKEEELMTLTPKFPGS